MCLLVLFLSLCLFVCLLFLLGVEVHLGLDVLQVAPLLLELRALAEGVLVLLLPDLRLQRRQQLRQVHLPSLARRPAERALELVPRLPRGASAHERERQVNGAGAHKGPGRDEWGELAGEKGELLRRIWGGTETTEAGGI